MARPLSITSGPGLRFATQLCRNATTAAMGAHIVLSKHAHHHGRQEGQKQHASVGRVKSMDTGTIAQKDAQSQFHGAGGGAAPDVIGALGYWGEVATPTSKADEDAKSAANLDCWKGRQSGNSNGTPPTGDKADANKKDASSSQNQNTGDTRKDEKTDEATVYQGQTCGMETPHWYTPWITIENYSPGCHIQHYNIIPSSLQDLTTPWMRNAMDSALLSGAISIGTDWLAKRLRLGQLATALGIGTGMLSSYAGLEMRERIRGKTIDTYPWYGRIKGNGFTGDIKAVEFHGRGPVVRQLLAPFYYEQAIVDVKGQIIGGVYTNTMSFGLKLEEHQQFPEKNFGEF